MSSELLPFLLKSLLNLYQTSNLHDVDITVGEQPSVEIFKAHSAILASRSPYFAAALSKQWAKREDGIAKLEKPNITPKVFEIILKYVICIYLSSLICII